ncbi:XRE family transcriptional regulator [Limosilactobacillus reuteri]|uniref:XRE family transcriptional regulator n=1 Tax=Limosilactobacillus reuteri TaxID=1598 RepID=UPI000A1E7E81|nr:XRE family transcriptional regulator [Limosilactobacillus reuteri]
MENLAAYVGSRIRNLRESRNMTPEKLAEKLGVSRVAVNRYETGARKANQDVLFELANIFHVSINDFFPKTTSIGNAQDLVDIYEQLLPDRQKAVYNYTTNQLDKQKNAYSSMLGEDRHIVYLYGAVSAGTGEYIPQDESKPEKIIVEGKVPDHDFAVRVNGDSMEPLFTDQQIIYVNKADKSEVRNHQFVIAELNGEFFIKKLQIDGDGSIKLISLNKKYSDIQIHDYDDFVIRGIVII